MNRMQPVTIDIDELTRRKAGQIAIDALREAGIDPRKALGVPMIRALAEEWGRGAMTRAQFIDNCQKVLILNPGLALE